MGRPDRLCSLCGTYYTDKKGHSLEDCWGIIHSQLLKSYRNVRDLQYKLQEAQKRTTEAEVKDV